MNTLYQGMVNQDEIDEAINELSIIKLELEKFPPDKVIWDIEDLSKQPPWGDNISRDITNLSNYFVTSDGSDFISVLFNALKRAKEINSCVEIKSM